MANLKIVVLDGKILNPGDAGWTPLRQLGDLTVHAETKPEDFAARARGADIVLVNKTLVRERELPALADCRLVGVLATGANNLALDELARAGIMACNVPGYGVEDVAQHAAALMLELARNTTRHSDSVKNGEWRTSGEWCYWLKTPRSLAGLTLGIIGFGAIGQAVGKIGHGLGMNILANARHRTAKTEYPFRYADLEDIWREADVISLHCPLTPETSRIINQKNIAAMKDGVWIINTARGGLVDEEAAAEALNTGKIAGLGTDVLVEEPPADNNPLLTAKNTLITPHMAWATLAARQNIIEIMAQNIKMIFGGKQQNVINNVERLKPESAQ